MRRPSGGPRELFALLLALPHIRADCPVATPGLRSWGTKPAHVDFVNGAPEDLSVFWVDTEGVDREVEPLLISGVTVGQDTSIGHVYRFLTTTQPRVLVKEYKVTGNAFVTITSCLPPGSNASEALSPRAAEFEGLRHGDPPCAPAAGSATWSCILALPRKQCEQREGEGYGFTAEQAKSANMLPGTTEDFRHDYQIRRIPTITTGPGFLKMNMTRKLRRLLAWYHKRRSSLESEPVVLGGYMQGKTKFAYLNHDQRMLDRVIREMRDVLQWWTQRPLMHTMTYGARVYHNDSVLINHVDRFATHVASAILQVDQQIPDPDAGWPLEIYTLERDCFLVYLQPGEMVLYEGARLKHGRPMRFRGDQYANVFTHFVPVAWPGLSQDEL